MEEKNTNATKRRNPVTWVPSVYFAMGLPFVVLNMVTVLMFKGLDISDAQIALWTSVIMLPWTLKPLWSPFLEMYRTKKFFVVLTQLLSGCLFGLVALALNLPSFFALSIALLGIIALSGATHDVATDGVYMKELSPENQAKYIGSFYTILLNFFSSSYFDMEMIVGRPCGQLYGLSSVSSSSIRACASFVLIR